MPRRNHVPQYRLYKQSGQAVVALSDGLGNRRDVLLGKYGSPASRLEYTRVVAEWEANDRRMPRRMPADDTTINELILAYYAHCQTYYRHPDGEPTSEADNIRLALRPLKEQYGHSRAADFDSLSLEAVRHHIIHSGRCRGRVNKDVSRIKRMFRWASAKKLVPLTTYQQLATVEGLRAGRSPARETEPVRPVPEAVVNATLPHLSPQVAAMVRLQLLTGMRPGEVVRLRGIDLDTSGPVWVYRPGSDRGPCGRHKTAWCGHQKAILIGPRGQEVLKPWLRPSPQEYLFQPREAVAACRAVRRQKRKTPLTPSQSRRQPKKHSKREPGDHYVVTAYDQAIAHACRKAFPPPEPLTQRKVETAKAWMSRLTEEQKAELSAWDRSHRWHPNQLRHTKASEIRREYGLDAARAVLGHRSPQITEVYAEIDVNKAAEVMARLG
jgi:integrase